MVSVPCYNIMGCFPRVCLLVCVFYGMVRLHHRSIFTTVLPSVMTDECLVTFQDSRTVYRDGTDLGPVSQTLMCRISGRSRVVLPLNRDYLTAHWLTSVLLFILYIFLNLRFLLIFCIYSFISIDWYCIQCSTFTCSGVIWSIVFILLPLSFGILAPGSRKHPTNTVWSRGGRVHADVSSWCITVDHAATSWRPRCH